MTLFPYILILLPILFESLSDGLSLRGLKVWSKQIKVLMVLSWLLIGYLWYNQLIDFWDSFIAYWLLRAILFNYVHNLAAGLPLNYIGQVSIVDRLVALLSFGQWYLILLFQIICAIALYFLI